MAFDINGILNTVIPLAIVVFFIVVIFKGFGPQLKAGFEWFMGLIGSGKDKIGEAVDGGGYEIVYR